MSDTTEKPINGAEPEDLAAMYQEAATTYAKNLSRHVQSNGGQIDALPLLIEVNILRMKFNVLLAALAHGAATGEAFEMARFDRSVIATVAANAEKLATPMIAVAQNTSGLRGL